jgi:hypothetical protein
MASPVVDYIPLTAAAGRPPATLELLALAGAIFLEAIALERRDEIRAAEFESGSGI